MARILVIDDNDQFRELMREILVNEGHRVILASNGIEGIALYRKEPADLVITDILMPEQDGTETIFELKKDFPSVKIIVISGGGVGDADEYLKAVALFANIDHALTKPFAMEEMLETVREVLNS